jgi:hypothetical protein
MLLGDRNHLATKGKIYSRLSAAARPIRKPGSGVHSICRRIDVHQTSS